VEDRILLLALRGRDGPVIEQLLAREGHSSRLCPSAAAMAEELARGAATAVITEESLVDADCSALDHWIGGQEAWSDFPFILLATKRAGRRPKEASRILERLGNVIVLERPIHSETLTSAISSALRVRRRQYEARGRLVALQTAEERLTQLNATLEVRIADRTEELSRANNLLMQEVTSRERAQAALVQAQKMEAVGQLTGGIAHDFNNLLTVISGNLELIERRATDDRQRRNAGFARQAADRAAKLTHQLLAFSRTQQLTVAALGLNALVEGMNDLLERTIGPQIEKRRLLDPAAPWVMADSNQLELAVLNLAINARDAMPDGGVLTIETEVADAPCEGLPDGSYGVIQVRDTGTGIAPHLIAKVFDPFFTTKALGKGTGLGLSQVFGIARQLGGTVQIDSVEGVGTSVAIWLPLAEAPARQRGATAAVGTPDAQGEARILVIDDDEGVRTFIVECLQSLGYSVAEAPNGEEGLARLVGERPDLLLVDFAMAGMNGTETAREARKIAPALPIVLATGYAEFDDPAAVDLVHSVLRKPFQIEDLATTIRDALASANAAPSLCN
jgi:signal transduction histidine kinase/ActR/RegA family two-component response regulator